MRRLHVIGLLALAIVFAALAGEILWGDQIMWGTLGDDQIIWGTLGASSDAIVWGS